MSSLYFLGDSITLGAWDSGGGWANHLIGHVMARTMAAGFRTGQFYCEPYNLGVSGNTILDIERRLVAEITSRAACDGREKTQIVFAAGVNDSVYLLGEGRPRFSDGEFEANLVELVERSLTVAANISFLGLLPVDDDLLNPIPWAPDKAYANEHVKRFEAIIGSVCEQYGLPFLPLFDRWQAMPDYRSLLIDGIHPNSAGHALLADQVADFLFTKNFDLFHAH